MSEETASENSKKIKKEDLPIFLADIPVIRTMKKRKKWGKRITYLGYVPLAYGLYLRLFGPDSLVVGIGGPTFWEYVRLNPFGVVAIGLLLIILGRWVKNSGYTKIEIYLDAKYTLYNSFGHPDETARLVGTFNRQEELVVRRQNLAPAENQPDTKSKVSRKS